MSEHHTRVITRTVTYVPCLACGKEDAHNVSHLLTGLARRWGSWSCDGCGASTEGTAGGGGVEYWLTGHKMLSDAVLLALTPGVPVLLVVKGRRSEAEALERHRYYYDEHTCPTNYLTEALCILTPDDPDPHGLFRYVTAVPMPEKGRDTFHNTSVEEVLAMFRRTAADFTEPARLFDSEEDP
jgi:hypothetical protein